LPPAHSTDPTLESTYRPKTLGALLSHRARLGLTVKAGLGAGTLPVAAGLLLPASH
jgi:hypothetical protein